MSADRPGPPSFGFVREDGRLRAHAQEAPVRRYMFELFAEHQRKKTVATILNAEGHRTRSGAEFNGTTIARLLTESAAKGIPDLADQLVSEDLWQRCNDILEAQKKSGGAARKVANLFAGLAHCGCGAKMYVPSNTDKYVCTVCRDKIPADDLEALFLRQAIHYTSLLEGFDARLLAQQWPRLTFDLKRSLITMLAHRIVISGKKVTFCLVAL